MIDANRYRVWCLSWEDTEEDGCDVVERWIDGAPLPRDTIAATYSIDAEDAAELYAEYAHNNRDGWECTWPLRFRVRKPDGTTEDFRVERDYDPTFAARAVTKEAKP